MKYLFFQLNKYSGNPTFVILMTSFAFISLGFIFMEINFCRITAFMATSGRMPAEQVSLFCHIF